jgi:hypothetical protein
MYNIITPLHLSHTKHVQRQRSTVYNANTNFMQQTKQMSRLLAAIVLVVVVATTTTSVHALPFTVDMTSAVYASLDMVYEPNALDQEGAGKVAAAYFYELSNSFPGSLCRRTLRVLANYGGDDFDVTYQSATDKAYTSKGITALLDLQWRACAVKESASKQMFDSKAMPARVWKDCLPSAHACKSARFTV